MLRFLTIREIQIKITLKFHLTPVRMAYLQNFLITPAGQDVGERYLPYSLLPYNEIIDLCSHYRNHYGEFSDN